MTSSTLVMVGAAFGGVVVLLYVVSLYNRLVRVRNGVDNALATIDVQLKQRCDLIPSIVDAVRGYMAHEKGVLEQLTALREKATASSASTDERLALDAQMSGLLRGVIARAEAHPDLKASETVVTLQRSLNEVEAQIAAARRTYNASATAFNSAIEVVPANLLASVLGFARRSLFEATTADRAVPRVDLRS